ncbi:MAG: hypothetical protein MJ126_09810 [Lachnospiraceae bacterium]|nr:hypothetical protein [Lachnospiraceae bacterium]
MMHLVFRESEMVKEFYELKAEIELSIASRRAAELMVRKYIDEFNSSTSADEMYVLDEYIKSFSKTIEIDDERIGYMRKQKKELKKELKSLGIKVK